MSWIDRLRALTRRDQLSRDLDDELSFHLEMRARDNLDAGMSPDEARRDARRRFGNPERIKQRTREVDLLTWLETVAADLRHAARLLWKSPGFTAVAALTLALGIGANTAIFSVVDAVLLRPLPYRPGGEVVVLGEEKACCEFAPTSPADLLDFQRASHSFEQLAGAAWHGFVMVRRGAEPLWLQGQEVTPNFFAVFGVPAALGRPLDAAIDRPGGARAAVLSDGAWRRHFGADPRALGGVVQLNGQPFTLVGVMPPEFRPLGGVDGAVGLILLIACANLANLLLARGTVRRREMALRASLGAGRLRLVRQLLTETLLLAALGGALGLLLARWGVRLLVALHPGNLPRIAEVRIDPEALLAGIALSLLAGLLAGLVPALRTMRVDLGSALKEGSRGAGSGAGGGHRLRRGLVVAEIAMSLALLIGAGLLIRSFGKLLAIDPGFQPEGVIAASLQLSPARYPSNPQVIAFAELLLRRARALPGVEAAGIVDYVPFSNSSVNGDIRLFGRPQPRPGDEITAEKRVVSGGYFSAMRIPLLRGRAFDDRDSPAAPVVIVNENLARFAWPNQDPIGRQLSWGDKEPWMRVVGVAGNVHQFSLADKATLDTYVPYRHAPYPAFTLVVRRAADPLGLAAQLRQEVLALDRQQPIAQLDLLANMVDQSLAQRRFQMLLIGSLAVLALLLASLGVYGVMSYAVQQRAQEIGVRVALGARRAQVFALVLRGSLAMSALGIAAGVLGSLLLGRWMQALLFGIRSHDPAVYALACGALFGISLLAAYLPARRAAAIDPAVTLRAE